MLYIAAIYFFEMLSHVVLAITTFVITNLDDLLILSFYFTNPQYKISQVIAGQFAGIVFLTSVSLVGLVLGNFVEPHWIALLGVFPILIGVKDLLSHSQGDDGESTDIEAKRTPWQFVSVALVTIANGGDNIGVYVPLFANTPLELIHVYLFIFLLFTGIWCAAALYFVSHPLIKKFFVRIGKVLMPYFLIVLGLIIMMDFFLWLWK